MGNTKEINKEQQNKALHGNGFNREITDTLEKLEDGSFIFLSTEKQFKMIDENKTFHGSENVTRMDHAMVLVNHYTQQILYIATDATTSERSDRTKGKAYNGAMLHRIKDGIKKEFLEENPEYIGYEFFLNNALIFPTELDSSMKNLENEKAMIRKLCTEINYKLHPYAKFGDINVALTLEDLEIIIDSIKKKMFTCSFSEDTLAEVWREYRNESEYKPVRRATLENYKNHREELLCGLLENPKKYHSEELKELCETLNIECGKNPTATKLINILISKLETEIAPA